MPVDKRLQDFFDSVPVNRFLGFELVTCSESGCVMTMPLREDFRQEGGVVQGGILGAFADTASAYAFVLGLEEGWTMTGVEFKVNFLVPARLDGGAVQAVATVVRRGRRLGVSEVLVSQGGTEVLKGLFTYLFRKQRPES